MFSTVNSVLEYTGFTTTISQIARAQSIIEIYVGKDEVDIESPSDLLLLDKMTSYQCIYMSENEDIVFKQVALMSQGQTDSNATFNTNMFAPFIAPLAVLASKGLTWKRSKSFRTGKIFHRGIWTDWRTL
jgi:hypothetical protein